MAASTIDATPAEVNIRGLVLGDDLIRTVTITGDYSDYDFAAQVRLDVSTKLDFICSTPIYVSPSTTFTIELDGTESAQLTPGVTYSWDLQWTAPDGNVLTIMRGSIYTLAQVTTP